MSAELGFDPQIVKNLIDSETGGTWDCTLVGKVGELGCFQIRPELHPEVDPLNFEEATRYFIGEYKAGREAAWVPCSCVQTVRLKIPNLPQGHAKYFTPDQTLESGKVLILKDRKSVV